MAANTGRADGRSCLYIVAFHHMIGDPIWFPGIAAAGGPGNRAPAIEAINVDRMVFFMFSLTYVRGAELFDGDPERIILNRFSNSRIGKSNDDCISLRDGICKRNVDIFSLIHWLLLNATCTTKNYMMPFGPQAYPIKIVGWPFLLG